MKGFQAILAFGLFQQIIGGGVLHTDDGPVDLSTEEFCTDVSQYSDPYYEQSDEQCCTTMYIPNCETKTKKVCMDVTNVICKPFVSSTAGVDIVNNPGGPNDIDSAAPQTFRPGQDGPGNSGGDGDDGRGNTGGGAPGTKAVLQDENVDLFECKPVEVVLTHVKQLPECKPVKSLNCETGWKVVDGEKVWSGEEDCTEVVWQDCVLVDTEVPFHAIESKCGPAGREAFATCVNKTVDVAVPVTRISFVQGTTCKPEKKRECVDMEYEDCSKPIRMEACSEVEVRKPKQDFIHKKKCLLPSDIERLTGGRQ